MLALVVFFFFFFFAAAAAAAPPLVVSPSHSPRALFESLADLRLSWATATRRPEPDVVQAAYRVVVEDVAAARPVFDSGRVAGAESVDVALPHVPLAPLRWHAYRVKVWDRDGRESAWGRGARAVLAGATGARGFGSARWIGARGAPANQFRVRVPAPHSPLHDCTLFAVGLGYAILHVNGARVDPTRVLDPAQTDYDARVVFGAFNVTALLHADAENVVAVELGNGWYSQDANVPPAQPRPDWGPPRLLLRLACDGQTLVVSSNASALWHMRAGPVTRDSVYHGEHYDARLEEPGWTRAGFDDVHWRTPVDELPAPAGALELEFAAPVRTHAPAVAAVAISRPVLNVAVVDFGQNLAGWVRLRLRGPRGLMVELRHAEHLDAAGLLNVDNLRAAAQTDTYILRGSRAPDWETYEPRFTVHGFRYVEVRNLPHAPALADVVAVPVHSELRAAGAFAPSDPVLAQIQHNILWTQLANAQSLPTDCPQRDERKGWMGDAGLTVDELLFNFDARDFLANWLADIAAAQRADGAVPDTVPFSFGQVPADPSWGSAFVRTLYYLHDHTGDRGVVAQFYPPVRAWVNFVLRAANQTGLARLYAYYGDWVPPPPSPKTNSSLCSAAALLSDVHHLVALAHVVGAEQDVAHYQRVYHALAAEFHAAFYAPARHGYADGSQSANALALALPDVVPAALRADVEKALLVDVLDTHHGHLSTGILGTAALFPALSLANRTDVALQVAQGTTYPSFGWTFSNPLENATTLWELWDAPLEGPGMNSRAHIMFGSIGAWFYRELAGFRTLGGGARGGVLVAPPDLPPLAVAATHVTPKGPLSVRWGRTAEGDYALALRVPPNLADVRVWLPGVHARARVFDGERRLLWEAGAPAAPGVQRAVPTLVRAEVLELAGVGSGVHEWRVV